MKLVRFGDSGFEKPGLLVNSEIFETSGFTAGYDEEFFGSNGIARLREWFEKSKSGLKAINANSVRLGPPFKRPSKIICVGLNYRKHADESNMPLPREPIIFFKSTTALCGPSDDVVIPKNSLKTDWEVELAFVVGAKASYILEEDAMKHIAGFCIHNDYSEREFQLERNGQWVKGKSCDTFAPMGPYLVPGNDMIKNHNKLRMWLKVNGKIMQDSSTDDMIFSVPKLLSYISQFMTLLPGDVISTGTPSGVGLGFNPPVYLKPNDLVELGIETLGEQRQLVKPYQLSS